MARWQIPLVSNIGEIAVTARVTAAFESNTISQPIYPRQTQMLGALKGGIVLTPDPTIYAAELKNTISQPLYNAPVNPQVFNLYPFPTPAVVVAPPTGYASWASSTIFQPSVQGRANPQAFTPYPFPFVAAVVAATSSRRSYMPYRSHRMR